MTTDPPDEPARDQRGRPRVRLRDWLRDHFQAQIPLPGGLSLTGIGLLGVVFVTVVALAAALWWFAIREPQAQVPHLVGLSRAEAESRLREAHLGLGAIYGEVSGQPVGTVLRTEPAVGSKLDRDAVVGLVLAVPAGATTQPSPGPLLSSSPQPVGAATLPGPGGPGPGQQPNQPDSGPGRPAPSPDRPAASAAPSILLGVGRSDPNPEYDSCDTGYRVDFSQQVSMTEPGRVTYRWLRSDGAGAPVSYLDFTEPGTQIATTWWQRWGAPGETIVGWQQIEILTPVSLRGQRIQMSYVCPDEPSSTS
jgi:PASTA domain